MSSALLEIEIGINPEIQDFGGLLLTWHGIFTAIGIAVGVYAALLVARRFGFLDDDVYSGALIAIPAGIIGARALYVIERWDTPAIDGVVDIFRVNEGGISIWGAMIGGILGALAYAWFRKLRIRRGLDALAVGGMLGLAIGRIGDLINGEHFAEQSDLPWAVAYTHSDSPSFTGYPVPDCVLSAIQGNPCAQHPAVGYEMLGDFLIVGLALLIIRYVKIEGIAFYASILLYSLMRFGVSELRLDSREVFAGLTTPQVASLAIIPIALLGLLYCYRQGAEPEGEAAGEPAPGGA